MPTFYNFTENGVAYSFDDVFIPADVFRDGNLWIWGNNDSGQLGTNDTTNRSTPVTLLSGGSNWKQVSCGRKHTAAIKTDGTLWTWGSGNYGALGNNSTITGSLTPITTFAGGTNWKQVSCGGDFNSSYTAAIKTDGTLWTWGAASNGKLGDNTLVQKSTPVTTFAGGTNWKQVSCAIRHTAAIKTDGTLWTWGYNFSSQLGTNDTITKSTPVTTFAGGNNWKQVEGGSSHTAAIKTDGTLWTWGFSGGGVLGNGIITANASTPVTTFAGGTNWKQVSCGYSYTEAIKTDGTLWVWGNNGLVQLGINATTSKSTPVTTFAGGRNWKQVSCGSNYTAAIKTDGTLWTWGSGSNLTLGINNTTNMSTPVTTFAGGTTWKQVDSGISNCAATTYIDSVI